MKKVRLFTTPVCPYCVSLKDFLSEKNIEFEEIDVSADEKAADEMIEKTGQMGVPVLDVDGEFIIGFDKEKISKSLDLK